MSDQSPVPVSTATTHAVSFEHELFWAEIRTLFADALQNVQPRMGTVLETNGAMLNVLPDGAAVFRALPHLAGRRYQANDRVIIAPVQGKPIIIGGVLSSVGVAEAVVGKEDILPKSITTDHLAEDFRIGADHIVDHSLTWYQIQKQGIWGSGAVTESESSFSPGSIGTSDIAEGAIITNRIANGAVTTTKIENSAVTTAKIENGAVTSGKLDEDYALAVHTHPAVDFTIPDYSITLTKMADNSVDQRVIANDSIGTAEIVNGVVSYLKLSENVQARIRNACIAAGLDAQCGT